MKSATQAFLLSLVIVGWTSVGGISTASAQDETQVPAADSRADAFDGAEEESLDSASGVTVEDMLSGDRDPAQARRNRRNQRQQRPAAPGRRQAPSAAAGSSATASAQQVAKIDVRGNKKIESDAVVSRLVTKVGEPYSQDKVRQDIEALFKAGYFYDVRVDRDSTSDGVRLVYTVVEKPTVTEVAFQGNDDVSADDLREAVPFKAFEILNMNKVREATEKVQKVYEDKGYFLARVTPKIVPVVEGETARVVFEIQENDKVKVKRITIIGNRNIKDGKLKGVLQTQEGGFFSFISGSGAYKQDAFDRDIQLLNFVYFNEGYVQVRIDRPQVYVTPDKKGIYITIRVEEGERYKVGTVDFAGDLLFDRPALDTAVEIDGSGWYMHETLLKDLRTMQAMYGDLGYAYANIIPRTRIRDRDKEVDITFEIDKGNKIYFGDINVVGNSRTRDKVVRRELLIREGELYNETRRRESLDNVKRLGFFDDIAFNAKTSPDNPDVMDIDIVVKERNTGTIQVGAGYSTYSKFIFNGQVNQINLFGRGQKLGISVDLSSNQSLFNLNFTEPYLFDTDWSFGVDAYQSERTVREYVETKKGGALRVGHPLAPYLRGFLRYKLDDTLIDLDDKFGDPSLFPVETANGLTSSLTGTLEYDKRNDRFAPTDGIYASGSLEYAGLGGDKQYTKGFFTGRYYKKVWKEFVLRNNLTYGFIRSNDPNSEPPYNELFLLGGANSLRGYDWYSIGERRRSTKRYNCLKAATPGEECPARVGGPLSDEEAEERARLPFGGTQQLYYQVELQFPLIAEAGINGVLFYDIGNANNGLAFDEFRQDVGFGFRWFSPIGPLRFEWGFPIGRRPGEDSSAFQFAIGAPF